MIWLLDPVSLNKAHARDASVFSPGGRFTNQYLPSGISTVKRKQQVARPIALFPPRATARITAQQGLFTIHGRQKAPLQQLAARAPIRMAAIALDINSAATMWNDLTTTGVHRLSLFPELESVAPYVKWSFQPTKRPPQRMAARKR